MKPILRISDWKTEPGPAPASDESRINILIVDDRKENLIALASLLEPLNYRLVTAGSGSEALRCMLKQDFAMVLLDVLMPNMDGFELAELMRSRLRTRHTPIVFITAGDGNDARASRGYSLGAIDYIFKPIVPEILKAKVQVLVDLFRKTESLARSEEKLRRELAEHRAADEALRLSERRSLAVIDEIVDYAIVSLDENGLVETWNKGAERLMGYAASEAVGKSFSMFYPEEKRRRATAETLWKRMRTEGRIEFEGWRVRKDGARFWGNSVITNMRGAAGEIRGFVSVTRDLTQSLKAAESERLQQREALQRQLVATVSHELRTPIAAIKASAETLRRGGLDDKARPRFIKIIENQSGRLASLVEDLLTVAEFESGKAQLEPKPIPLRAFARDYAAELAPLAARKNISVRVLIEEEFDVWMDQAQLSRIFQNLLDNAIKYSKAGGSVRLEGRRIDGRRAHVSVRDTGIGIHPKDMPLIFEQFHRADVARAHAPRGTGLGLYITKTIVESNGGRLWAESERAKGSVFHFTVPLARKAGA